MTETNNSKNTLNINNMIDTRLFLTFGNKYRKKLNMSKITIGMKTNAKFTNISEIVAYSNMLIPYIP